MTKKHDTVCMSMEHAAHCPQSRQSARHSLQSSELAPPPLHLQASVAPPLFCSGGTHSPGREGAGRDNSDEETDTLVLEVKYNPSTTAVFLA
jgi:hypothetical protein